MSLDSARMLKLMAYADGELSDKEREEVEAWLVSDEDSLRFTNDLANLGTYVKTGHETSKDAKAIASFDIAGVVMAQVQAKKPTSIAAPAVAPVVQLQPKRRMTTYVAAALALAASVFFIMKGQPREQPMSQAPTPMTTPAAAPEPQVVASNEVSNPESPSESDVEVENTGKGVSVIYLPNQSTLTTSVMMWIDDTGGK